MIRGLLAWMRVLLLSGDRATDLLLELFAGSHDQCIALPELLHIRKFLLFGQPGSGRL